MIGIGIATRFGGAFHLDDARIPKESWIERQRRLWEEALARLEKALSKQTGKGEKS